VRDAPIFHAEPLGLNIDLTNAGKLKDALEKVKETKRGKELFDRMDLDKATYKIVEGNRGEAYYDPATKTIVVDPNFHPSIDTTNGPYSSPTDRILGHEMGHAATGVGDTGPGRMNNVNMNENPIAIELGEPPRTKY